MKRFGRLHKGLVFLVVTALVGVALISCARLYLTSRHASDQIVEKVQAVLGVPVRIDEVDVGLAGDSFLRNLQVYEADGQRPDTPWLRVKDIQADLSAADVVGGDATPRHLVLSAASLTLRFDANGHLLTALPHLKPTGRPFPQFVLQRSRLTLDQEGRTPMRIEDLNAEANDRDGVLAFSGTIHDDYWGEWTVEGSFKLEGQLRLKLTTRHTTVTQEKLDRLPFVSPSVWQQVKLNGETPVDFELHFQLASAAGRGLGDKHVHYRVDLAPVNTEVHVPSIALHADQANGKVAIEDRLVQLRDVHGRTADGTIHLPKADLDFRTTPSDLTFDVGVRKVDLRKLPSSWKIPTSKLVKGPMALTGQARLRVRIANGKAQTTGDGEGIVETVFLRTPLPPIKVRLHADGERFHFSTPSASLRDLPKVSPSPVP